MKTFAIILGLLFLYFPLKLIGTIFLNIVGLPGSLIAFNSSNHKQPKYIIGLFFCLIAHLYVYFSIMIYILNWVRHLNNPESFSKYFIWAFCLILFSGTIEGIYRTAHREFLENYTEFLNPQIESLFILRILVFIGFWIFLFFPELSNPFWSWVNNLGFPL